MCFLNTHERKHNAVPIESIKSTNIKGAISVKLPFKNVLSLYIISRYT